MEIKRLNNCTNNPRFRQPDFAGTGTEAESARKGERRRSEPPHGKDLAGEKAQKRPRFRHAKTAKDSDSMTTGNERYRTFTNLQFNCRFVKRGTNHEDPVQVQISGHNKNEPALPIRFLI
jgi:hypothetical protein